MARYPRGFGNRQRGRSNYGVLLVFIAAGFALIPSPVESSVRVTQVSGEDVAAVMLLAVGVAVTIAAPVGALVAAPIGATLGLWNGLLLFGITRVFYYPMIADKRRYKRVAFLACVSTSILVLLIDWATNGYPNVFFSAPWRSYTNLKAILDSDDGHSWSITVDGADEWSLADVGGILVVGLLALLPILAFSLAMSFAGRLGAMWYANVVPEIGTSRRNRRLAVGFGKFDTSRE